MATTFEKPRDVVGGLLVVTIVDLLLGRALRRQLIPIGAGLLPDDPELADGGTRGGDGQALRDQARDEAADLLVMGGYGHSRLREMMLGGTTRSMLEHMTLPVLFSH